MSLFQQTLELSIFTIEKCRPRADITSQSI